MLKKFSTLLLCSSLALPLMAQAQSMLSTQELKSEPAANAATAAKVSKGTKVDILQRKGFWVEVKAGNQQGWTRLNNVKTEAGTSGLASLETGRMASGNIVSSTGVRGLDAVELENAQPDQRELAKLEALAVNKREADKFAKDGKLKSRKLAYVQPGNNK